jgi:hypothetical protein
MRIEKTSNYKRFKLIGGNRGISKAHVKHIKESMAEKVIPVPIIVNEKFEIIDGQHRFTAASELKHPIHFVKIPGLGLPDVQRLNSNSKNWTLNDYLQSYLDLGKKSYYDYADFMEEFGFKHEQNFILLTNGNLSHLRRTQFQRGKFRITSDQLEWGRMAAERIIEIGSKFEKERDATGARYFVGACCAAFNVKRYDHKHMMKKIHARRNPLTPQASLQDYTRMLEEVYFYHMSDANKFRLDV